jgi:hypothetical protein
MLVEKTNDWPELILLAVLKNPFPKHGENHATNTVDISANRIKEVPAKN